MDDDEKLWATPREFQFQRPGFLWVLKIEAQTGRITLNEEIPQAQAVYEFVRLCNELLKQQSH